MARCPIDWVRIELTRDAFLELHVVGGPDDLSWRALAPDKTLGSAATRILAEDPAALADETGVDIGKILAFRTASPKSTTAPLVLSTRQGCVPWSVADGNHRAVAKAMYVLDGGTYRSQVAYVGIGANPVVQPLRDRVCGVLRYPVGGSSASR